MNRQRLRQDLPGHRTLPSASRRTGDLNAGIGGEIDAQPPLSHTAQKGTADRNEA